MSEIPAGQNRGAELVSSTISNPQTVGKLIGKDPDLNGELESEVDTFNVEELKITVSSLLTNLRRDDDDAWGQDQRDASLSLLQLLPLDKIPQRRLIDLYIAAVDSLNEEADLYGPALSMIEAGEALAFDFPQNQETLHRVDNSWGAFFHRSKGEEEDKGKLRYEIYRLRNSMSLTISEDLGKREKPEMELQFESLLQRYLEVTRSGRSFKLELWRNTPRFREEASRYGIDLARFWNLSNPDDVTKAIKLIVDVKPEGFERLSEKIKNRTDVDIGTASDDEIMVVSDEIVSEAQSTAKEIESSARSFSDTFSRIQQTLEKVNKGDLPAKAIENIIQFLVKNGISNPPNNASQLLELLSDPRNLGILEESFNQSQRERFALVNLIRTSLRLEGRQNNFRLISRIKEDLYLGDETGDCTAFHLNVGFNAWTLPVWLTDPGFNMFVVEDDDGKLISKLGVFIAVADNKPVLLIDSLEIGSGIEEARAKELLNQGLEYLKEWARRIGLESVYANAISNTPFVQEFLKDKTREGKGQFSLLGNVDGVAEYRLNATGERFLEKIYLQTNDEDEDPLSNIYFYLTENDLIPEETSEGTYAALLYTYPNLIELIPELTDYRNLKTLLPTLDERIERLVEEKKKKLIEQSYKASEDEDREITEKIDELEREAHNYGWIHSFQQLLDMGFTEDEIPDLIEHHANAENIGGIGVFGRITSNKLLKLA